MPNPGDTYVQLISTCKNYGATLLAVSKERKEKEILELYKSGHRIFGENRAHELIIKASLLPSDIEWHLIGHLQSNKVKSILPFLTCIQSLDSWKLWQKINEEATEAKIEIECLLQIKVAVEETKYGWDFDELEKTLEQGDFNNLKSVHITGVMGLASMTLDMEKVRNEMRVLKNHFDYLRKNYFKDHDRFNILSMGMSGDYTIALEEGSTMIRIGSLLFR